MCAFLCKVEYGTVKSSPANWVAWNNLTQEQKDDVGGTDTFTGIFIYADRWEGAGFVFYKQP
jgi:hypothetical protein